MKYLLVAVFLLTATGASAECGKASWYTGHRTASGERMKNSAMTAAHKHLPFGTIVSVLNVKTGKRINVKINDRGPFVKGRIIDLSKGAAKALGINGIGNVCIDRKK